MRRIKNGGYSLVEVMVAMVGLSLVALLLTSVLMTSMRSSSAAQESDQALAAAKAKMNELTAPNAVIGNKFNDTIKINNRDYERSWKINGFDSKPADNAPRPWVVAVKAGLKGSTEDKWVSVLGYINPDDICDPAKPTTPFARPLIKDHKDAAKTIDERVLIEIKLEFGDEPQQPATNIPTKLFSVNVNPAEDVDKVEYIDQIVYKNMKFNNSLIDVLTFVGGKDFQINRGVLPKKNAGGINFVEENDSLEVEVYFANCNPDTYNPGNNRTRVVVKFVAGEADLFVQINPSELRIPELFTDSISGVISTQTPNRSFATISTNGTITRSVIPSPFILNGTNIEINGSSYNFDYETTPIEYDLKVIAEKGGQIDSTSSKFKIIPMNEAPFGWSYVAATAGSEASHTGGKITKTDGDLVVGTIYTDRFAAGDKLGDPDIKLGNPDINMAHRINTVEISGTGASYFTAVSTFDDVFQLKLNSPIPAEYLSETLEISLTISQSGLEDGKGVDGVLTRNIHLLFEVAENIACWHDHIPTEPSSTNGNVNGSLRFSSGGILQVRNSDGNWTNSNPNVTKANCKLNCDSYTTMGTAYQSPGVVRENNGVLWIKVDYANHNLSNPSPNWAKIADCGAGGSGGVGQKYDVTFESNGGSKVTDTSVISNTIIAKPKDPTRAEYTFDGWYKNVALTELWNFATDKVTSDIKLYAKWTQKTYSVVYNCDGGTGCPNNNSIATSPLAKPADPTRVGYTFKGWSSTQNGAIVTFPYTLTDGTNTLWAVWTDCRYTITFDYQGGSGTPASWKQTVCGEEYTFTAPANRAGFTFGGWKTAVSCGGNLVGNTGAKFTPDKDITLYACWTGCLSEIEFDYDGGSGGPEKMAQTTSCDEYLTLPTPTKSGWVFKGWWTTKGTAPNCGGGTHIGDAGYSYRPTANTKLFACWEQITFDVSFNCCVDKDCSLPTLSIKSPSPLTKATLDGVTKPTRTGTGYTYTFKHWSEACGGTEISLPKVLTTSTILCAVWDSTVVPTSSWCDPISESWTSGKTYANGDIVKHSGNLFIKGDWTDNTTQPNNATGWKLIGSCGTPITTDWNSNTTYNAVGMAVCYSGRVYVIKSAMWNPSATTPNNNTTNWQVLGSCQ